MTQPGALAHPPDDRTALQDGLRLTAVALTDAEIPFALVGGYAAWARRAAMKPACSRCPGSI